MEAELQCIATPYIKNKIIIIIKNYCPFPARFPIQMANSKMSSCTFFKKIIIMAVSLLLFRSHRGRLGERSMGDHEAGELVSAGSHVLCQITMAFGALSSFPSV